MDASSKKKKQTIKKYIDEIKRKVKRTKDIKDKIEAIKLKAKNDTLKKELKVSRKHKETNKKMPVKTRSTQVLQISEYLKPSSGRLNEKLAGLLSELSSIMVKNGDQIRARVYKKAEETVLSIVEDITSVDQLKGKPGIGPTIMDKVNEFLKTGKLDLIEREKAKPEYIFSDIYGIGPKKAKDLADKGFKTIADLRKKRDEVLNEVQKMGLEYYEDILERIPRIEIDAFDKDFTKYIKLVGDKDTNYEIVGSYRRGASTSGDIDIIITSKDPAVFDRFIDKLIETKHIIHVLSRGKSKCLVIARLAGEKYARRVDFLYTTAEEYPFAVLYFTGSKAFNTVMRQHALSIKYSLNEHGFTKMTEQGKKDEKMDKVFKDEKEIFNFLGMVYKSPEERIDGRSVEYISNKAVTPETQYVSNKAVTPEIQNVSNKRVSPIKEQQQEEQEQPEQQQEKIQKKEKKEKKERKPRQKKIVITNENVAVSVIPVIDNNTSKTSGNNKTEVKDSKEQLLEFQSKGQGYLDTLIETEIIAIMEFANELYRNDEPLLTDNEYDIIEDYVKEKYPNNAQLKKIGAPITGKNKAQLPYEMASMDKIKPESNALPGWKKKYAGPYVISCKLDGVSGLYTTEGPKPKLYTRGDGKVGQDISHLIKLLNLPKGKGIVVRGEFIMPKKVFEDRYTEKFANPRNLVSGIVNSKSIDDKSKDIHFVAYEVIKPELKPSEQMKKINELKFKTVQNKTLDTLTVDVLSELLTDWRKTYDYEIDGIIVTDDNIYKRESGNPDHSFAFKMVMSEQLAESKVVDVEWTASKSGYLKPVVIIQPIKLGGVTIKRVTGFNGKFIEENKIGIGAVLQIVRSGDVIPYIKSVVVPATKTKMPDIPYIWTDTHVDIKIEDLEGDETVQMKKIVAFFKSLEVDGFQEGNAKKIIKGGFNTIAKILKMSVKDFETVDGFKTKMATKIADSIKEKISDASLLDIMVASGSFGRGLGERKMKPMMESFPTILQSAETNANKIELLKTIPGVGKENATDFVENIPVFLKFLKDCDLEEKLTDSIVVSRSSKKSFDTSHKLYGLKVVMSKVRDKEIIDALGSYGGELQDSIKSGTNVLIVPNKEESSNKTEAAIKKGIPIMTPSEFKEKYM